MAIAVAKPLMTYTVGDLMSPQVVMIPVEMSIQGAARLLSRSQVSGAPVVDAEGRCVGVVSATDFVHWAEGNGRRASPDRTEECMCSAWQILEEKDFPETCVRTLMTKDPVTATPATKIGVVAQMMLDAHIHRAIVVDERRRPIGVVSSTDILAAVARADHN